MLPNCRNFITNVSNGFKNAVNALEASKPVQNGRMYYKMDTIVQNGRRGFKMATMSRKDSKLHENGESFFQIIVTSWAAQDRGQVFSTFCMKRLRCEVETISKGRKKISNEFLRDRKKSILEILS